jgi:predicted phosphodiesterase
MRKLVQFILLKPILWIVRNFTSEPDRERIFTALSELREKIEQTPGKKGFVIPCDISADRYIVFSDQHKGRKNGADDFMLAEEAYVGALEYYDGENFHLICLGDCEELWENTIVQIKNHNSLSFEAEKKFFRRKAFTKVFGNHDLDWDIDPLSAKYLQEIYDEPIAILEGIILQVKIRERNFSILCTHGHQGDLQSDGNWFSKFFVSKIWAPLQAYLRINPNTPAYDQDLKTLHNSMMYEWSSQQQDLLLITGHTHQPVFESLTHVERLQRDRQRALFENNQEWAGSLADQIAWQSKNDQEPADYLKTKPSYFNSGCCCYSDGDITGIEIADGNIRLIKWKKVSENLQRTILAENTLENVMDGLRTTA